MLCAFARAASAQDFPITVDASPLSTTSVVLAPNTLLSESTSQVLSLQVGLHEIFYGSGSPTPAVIFEVTPTGTVAYDAALGGILQGEGTSSLILVGAVIRVNATPLSTTNCSFSGTPLTPPDWEVVQTLHLLPGGHEFFYGAGSPTPRINFVVGADSRISYAPALEGILLGAGTSNLTLAGTVSQAYFSLRSLDSQLALPRTTLATRDESLQVIRDRVV